jgi:hypothetical protein
LSGVSLLVVEGSMSRVEEATSISMSIRVNAAARFTTSISAYISSQYVVMTACTAALRDFAS